MLWMHKIVVMSECQGSTQFFAAGVGVYTYQTAVVTIFRGSEIFLSGCCLNVTELR